MSGGISPAFSQDLEDFCLRLVLRSTITKRKQNKKKASTVLFKGIPGHNVFVTVAITETRLRSLIVIKECVMYVFLG